MSDLLRLTESGQPVVACKSCAHEFPLGITGLNSPGSELRMTGWTTPCPHCGAEHSYNAVWPA